MCRTELIKKVSGTTLRVKSMVRSLRFYRDILRLKLVYGGEESSFSSFDIGGTHLNLELSQDVDTGWGRIIFHCGDVDDAHAYLISKGYDAPESVNAPWGERFFHLKDPDGHELSMAKPLGRSYLRKG
jgi:catechol 2,3-dioxygenase-like lactoylglutathione lyase family enzyme